MDAEIVSLALCTNSNFVTSFYVRRSYKKVTSFQKIIIWGFLFLIFVVILMLSLKHKHSLAFMHDMLYAV